MKAIILAAGYATRLYPLTIDQPKPLLPIADKPILNHLVSKIMDLGTVDQIYIVTNDKFNPHFCEWLKKEKPLIPCVIVNDGTTSNDNRLGAIGDIQFVIEREKISDDLMILAGDNMFDFGLEDFMDFFRKNGTSVACFELKDTREASRYGVLELDGKKRVIRFLEKPAQPPSKLISMGIYAFVKEDVDSVQKYLDGGGKQDAPGYFLEWLSKNKNVYGYPVQGLWFDIGDLESYHRADEIYKGLKDSKEDKGMKERKLFTSEAVAIGHPDKVADQISDSILDAYLQIDPNARVAVETLVMTNRVVVAGQVTAKGEVNIEKVVRQTIKEIGYVEPSIGFDDKTCKIDVQLDRQSPDIAQGVNEGEGMFKEMGAGDQGMMFGYACRETEELMPLPIMLSRHMMDRLYELRASGTLPYLRPDGKCQVTVEYHGNEPLRVHTIVVSTQHSADANYETIRKDIIEQVIKKAVPQSLMDEKTLIYVNPTGRFVVGGPQGDTGLTGRKIIVDTYGGMGRHGGGCFSGKDATKVDRSAQYASRYVAKNVVAAGLADRCEVQLAYAIGVAEPVSISVDCFGTGHIPESKIVHLIREHFKLTPRGIIESLDLRKPIYKETARFGHFGRANTWEKTDKAQILRKEAGLEEKASTAGVSR